MSLLLIISLLINFTNLSKDCRNFPTQFSLFLRSFYNRQVRYYLKIIFQFPTLKNSFEGTNSIKVTFSILQRGREWEEILDNKLDNNRDVRDCKFSTVEEKGPFASRCFAEAERRAFDREFELVMGAIHSASPLMRGNLM